MFFSGKRFKFIIILLVSAFFLCSCGEEKNNPFKKLVIGNDFYYWESQGDSTIGDAIANNQNFKKLEDKSETNLMRMFGKKQKIVWIRANFEIPETFRNISLGLVIPQLRTADQVYCNGNFIAQYGSFPPKENSTQYMSHFYSLPLNVLNQYGNNTIYIKVLIHGNSGISTHAFIQPAFLAHPAYERLNFYHSRIYVSLFGVIFFSFFMYLSVYLTLNKKKFKVYMDFSLLNLFSSFFLIYFFAMEIPLYSEGKIPFLWFAKFTLIIPSYFLSYLIVRFGCHFYESKTPFWVRIVRLLIIVVQIIPTLFASNYDLLLEIAPFMMSLLVLHLLGGCIELVIHIIKKESRSKALVFTIGLLPFILCAILDVVLRLIDSSKSYPYFMIFGWIGTIAAFTIMLSIRFGFIYRRNETLTNHLQKEVDKQTRKLKTANEELSELNRQLEKAKRHSDMDLEMAFSVQKNFLPQPVKYFKGWELAVCYMPQAKVSGDLYDYYSYNDILNGVSLFDVSGHGLSAGLVTMLSKNIISRLFQQGYRSNDSIDKILTKINSTIIYEKGEIDNYMTGILCRFENDEENDLCRVSLGNAGHPFPLLYSKETNDIKSVLGTDEKKHYGATGMKGIEVSFASSNFSMKTGDILVLYTDGITESTNKNGEQYGIERIKDSVMNNNDKPAREITDEILKSLVNFSEGIPFNDDISLVVARRVEMDREFQNENTENEADRNLEELKPVD